MSPSLSRRLISVSRILNCDFPASNRCGNGRMRSRPQDCTCDNSDVEAGRTGCTTRSEKSGARFTSVFSAILLDLNLKISRALLFRSLNSGDKWASSILSPVGADGTGFAFVRTTISRTRRLKTLRSHRSSPPARGKGEAIAFWMASSALLPSMSSPPP